jgi:alkylation response protein AidB-like acyl-CoA dehydrogenase
MDFSPTQEQAALKESARRLCQRDYGFEQRRHRMRGADGFSRDLWKTFADLGWLGAGLSEDDFGAVKTQARRTADGWRLNGRKAFVLGGSSADILLVSARTSSGVTLFEVPADADGLQIIAYHAVDGRRVADLVLTEVALGETARIGAEGRALAGIELAVDHGVIALMAECVGAMDAALWLTRDYLSTRKQFGVTLNTFQALQHRMADMLVETELARSMLLCGIAALADLDPPSRRAGVSAAKVQIAEAAVKVTGEAIQMHGGIGVTEEYVVGHFYKRAVLARGLFGSIDLHLERFAAWSRKAVA